MMSEQGQSFVTAILALRHADVDTLVQKLHHTFGVIQTMSAQEVIVCVQTIEYVAQERALRGDPTVGALLKACHLRMVVLEGSSSSGFANAFRALIVPHTENKQDGSGNCG